MGWSSMMWLAGSLVAAEVLGVARVVSQVVLLEVGRVRGSRMSACSWWEGFSWASVCRHALPSIFYSCSPAYSNWETVSRLCAQDN